jgi:hypothetical protein
MILLKMYGVPTAMLKRHLTETPTKKFVCRVW